MYMCTSALLLPLRDECRLVRLAARRRAPHAQAVSAATVLGHLYNPKRQVWRGFSGFETSVKPTSLRFDKPSSERLRCGWAARLCREWLDYFGGLTENCEEKRGFHKATLALSGTVLTNVILHLLQA
jgi:hypothetical protein